jgi:hypothetical protein
VSNKIFVIYDAEAWLFGLLQSRMHMVWLRAVGGRMKADYSYANSLVYNTFPVPNLTEQFKGLLLTGALEILDAREQFADKTLAQLYDPDHMPQILRRAHERLDATVDRLYQSREFGSDDERLEILFQMYEDVVGSREGRLAHA